MPGLMAVEPREQFVCMFVHYLRSYRYEEAGQSLTSWLLFAAIVVMLVVRAQAT